jgi:hypothetical protein
VYSVRLFSLLAARLSGFAAAFNDVDGSGTRADPKYLSVLESMCQANMTHGTVEIDAVTRFENDFFVEFGDQSDTSCKDVNDFFALVLDQRAEVLPFPPLDPRLERDDALPDYISAEHLVIVGFGLEDLAFAVPCD